jgi:hypothetical protein
MIICIDYDDTFTADQYLWGSFIESAMASGHDVWCVSARSDESMAEARASIGLVIGEDRCVGTNGAAKRDFLFKTRGVYGDIWIDDMPETVCGDYLPTTGGLWVTQYDGGAAS